MKRGALWPKNQKEYFCRINLKEPDSPELKIEFIELVQVKFIEWKQMKIRTSMIQKLKLSLKPLMKHVSILNVLQHY